MTNLDAQPSCLLAMMVPAIVTTYCNNGGGAEYNQPQHLRTMCELGHLLAYIISNVLSCYKPSTTKLTVWCALWAGGIIGPYFFKNDEGHNVTVNGDRYRAMITNFFIPELNNHDVQELWFQQDGATCHTARATIDLLKDTLGDRLISRFGKVNWPPRSCDLTPLDCFMWDYVKSLVYADKPQTLDHLEDNIRRVIADIRPQMLETFIEADAQTAHHDYRYRFEHAKEWVNAHVTPM
ncbi:uncharacterized protein TNCV_2159761 [Trichonephila clavipes]|nr:uncharacterized protein TNCV_2159761 [Trichonephila clavipes]